MKVSFEFQLPSILAAMFIESANEAVKELHERGVVSELVQFDPTAVNTIRLDTKEKTDLFLNCMAAALTQAADDKKLQNEISQN